MLRVIVFSVLSLVLVNSASAMDNKILGAIIGAGAGAAIGHSVDRTGGSGKGAVIGAIGGYLLGSQLDNAQAQPQAVSTPTSSAYTPVSDCSRAQQLFNDADAAYDMEQKVYLLEQAVDLCVGNARLHNDLGVAYFNRNRPYDKDRARDELNEALRIDPNYNVARNNLRQLDYR